MNKEAMYYEQLEQNAVRCVLCPHSCKLTEGKTGICKARENIGGKLYSRNYGNIAAVAMDPIEKKPLYHFYPGKYILSIGTTGCNFSCSFCQNHHIAQAEADEQNANSIEPSYLVKLCRDEEDCIGIAYTYNEPSIWYEYILETAAFFREKEFKNVMVTNGYISEKPLKQLLPYIDAFNIDVKGFSEKYYKEVCGGSLEHVKRTVELAAESSHVEVTTLVVPGLNDSQEEIRKMAEWLAGIKPSIPLHLSRYFPQYKLNIPPTPVDTILKLKSAAEEYLDYVYLGNISGTDNSTYCPKCGVLLLKRDRGIIYEHLEGEECTKCGAVIEIVGTKDY